MERVLLFLLIGCVVVGAVILPITIFTSYDLFSDSVLVIIPNLTANAYSPNGFYNYFENLCDESCLTIQLNPMINHGYSSSSNAVIILTEKYYSILDYTLIDNPDYINSYDHLIILHNEYVTREMFDSITNHPSVFYLYPNALYGEVTIENIDSKFYMTLISGHGVNGKDNAFDWKYENTRPDEFDNECLDYTWKVIDNGYQLDCFPENAIINDDSILQFIEDNT